MKYGNYFLFHSVSLLYQAPLARGSSALPSVLLELALEVRALLPSRRRLQTRQQAELLSRRGLPLVAITTMSKRKSLRVTNAKLLLN